MTTLLGSDVHEREIVQSRASGGVAGVAALLGASLAMLVASPRHADAQTFQPNICGEASCASSSLQVYSYFQGPNCTGPEYIDVSSANGGQTGAWDGGGGTDQPGRVWNGNELGSIEVRSYRKSKYWYGENCTNYATPQLEKKVKRVYRASCTRRVQAAAPYYYKTNGGYFAVGDILIFDASGGLVGEINAGLQLLKWGENTNIVSHAAYCSRINASGACIEVIENHASEDEENLNHQSNGCRSIDKRKIADLAPGVHRVYALTHPKGGFVMAPGSALRSSIQTYMAGAVPARDACGKGNGCAPPSGSQPSACSTLSATDPNFPQYGCTRLQPGGGCGKAYVPYTPWGSNQCHLKFKRDSGYGYMIGNYGNASVNKVWNTPSAGTVSTGQCTSFVAAPLASTEGKGTLSFTSAQVGVLADKLYQNAFNMCTQYYGPNLFKKLFSCIFGFGNCIDKNEACSNAANDVVNLFLWHDGQGCVSTGYGPGSYFPQTYNLRDVSNVTAPASLLHGLEGDYGTTTTRIQNKGVLTRFAWAQAYSSQCFDYAAVRPVEHECGNQICELERGEDTTCSDCNRLVAGETAMKLAEIGASPATGDPTTFLCQDNNSASTCQKGYPLNTVVSLQATPLSRCVLSGNAYVDGTPVSVSSTGVFNVTMNRSHQLSGPSQRDNGTTCDAYSGMFCQSSCQCGVNGQCTSGRCSCQSTSTECTKTTTGCIY